MSRITDLFKRKPNGVLNVYCTAGFPRADSTIPVMKALTAAGADLIELGMPYSDPLADGPLIQASSAQALANGMTIARLFEQLGNLRAPGSPFGDIPVLLMGYMNPVLQYGFEKFCADAQKAGIDGLILPDLPLHEFESEFGPIIRRYGLDFVFLVTPETSEERIRRLDAASSGFLYAVSSSSTTGKNKDLSAQENYFRRLSSLKLKNPVLVGFGIKDRRSFQQASQFTNGAIIGTAYIQAIGNTQDIEGATKTFLHGILG